MKSIRSRIVWLFGLMVLFAGFGFCGLTVAYSTGTFGSGTYGSCVYGQACSISLSSNGNISLNVTPSSGGSCTIESDSATVMTDDSDGYSLTLSDSGTNTSLVNGSHSIAATSGTFASPAVLTANSWGYRVDGVGSFGSGPTTSQTNVSPGSLVFAGLEPSDQPADTIVSSAGAADPAVSTTVWYGVCANTAVPSGTYSSQALYTAVAN